MKDSLGVVYVGYNWLVIQKPKVEIFTEHVYEYQENDTQQERGVYIAKDVTQHTAVLGSHSDGPASAPD